jgi:hypothetical protein
MKRRPPADHHIDSETALDYLDHRLDAARARQVEEHLARPCAGCRERLRQLSALLQRMRLDRVPEVPATARARALEAFVPGERVSPLREAATRVARLLFDSWTEPLPAMTRRAVGEARRLRYAADDGALELECEIESPGVVTLRGRLEIAEAPLHRVEVAVGGELRTAWPDAGGAFAFERVPAGEARLLIEGPQARFRLPAIDL